MEALKELVEPDTMQSLVHRGCSHLNISNALQSMSRGGGDSQLNFGYGCAARSFKIEPFARPIFVKITPLPRLISLLKVP